MDFKTKQDVFNYLSSFLTDERRDIINRTAENRTKYLTIVLEDIYQPQNASAVLRSAECFGLQNIHIIENVNEYKLNPKVLRGSSNWLDIKKYNNKKENTLNCINDLKRDGYKIIATSPHKYDCLLEDLPIIDKTAILFGSEINGLSEIAMQNCDGFVKIPMFGFTESLNISVSAAIVLQNLSSKLRNSDINWKLSEEEIFELKYNWVVKSSKRPELLIKHFLVSRI